MHLLIHRLLLLILLIVNGYHEKANHFYLYLMVSWIGLTSAQRYLTSGNMHPYPGTALLEYFPKEPVKCPDPLVFRILQDSMAKMQDSMASYVVRGRPFSYAGETVPPRRQDSMGQYGRLIFGITGRSRFTENSALRGPTRPFPQICRQCTTERERVREMKFCQKVPGQPPEKTRMKPSYQSRKAA